MVERKSEQRTDRDTSPSGAANRGHAILPAETAHILSLQRTAGNRAICQWLSLQRTPPQGDATPGENGRQTSSSGTVTVPLESLIRRPAPVPETALRQAVSAAGTGQASPPAVGTGQASPPAAGAGQASSPPAAGTGQASSPPAAGAGQASPPAAGAGQASPPAAGTGQASSPPAAGTGQASPPAAGAGQASPPAAGTGQAPPPPGLWFPGSPGWRDPDHPVRFGVDLAATFQAPYVVFENTGPRHLNYGQGDMPLTLGVGLLPRNLTFGVYRPTGGTFQLHLGHEPTLQGFAGFQGLGSGVAPTFGFGLQGDILEGNWNDYVDFHFLMGAIGVTWSRAMADAPLAASGAASLSSMLELRPFAKSCDAWQRVSIQITPLGVSAPLSGSGSPQLLGTAAINFNLFGYDPPDNCESQQQGHR